MAILSVLFICLSCVNAEEINDADIGTADDIIGVASDDSDVVSSADVVKYYVNGSAATSGNGSESSPFKELNEAIPKAESSQNVEIYVASGTYLIGSRSDINLNHVADGGSLSIIGYGGDVTFDMQNKYDFLSVGYNSKVNISNLIITNGYSMNYNYQGIVTSNGNLNIINCSFINNAAYTGAVRGSAKIYSSLFKDNSATIYYDGIDFRGTGLIYNSTFYGNTRGSSIYGEGNLVIDKSKFLDFNSVSCVYSYSPVELTNCVFDNCSESRILVTVNSDLVLSNNTLSNNGYLCFANSITCLGVIEVLDNKTIDFEGFGVDLTAKIYDDNGNLIRPESVDFYINGTKAGTAYYNQDDGYKLNYQKVLNGTYIISAGSDYLYNFTVKTATLNAVPPKDKNVKYYVNGSAAVSGNGSIDSPFQSITEAVALANGFQNVEIYIASGRYVFNDYTISISLNHEDGEGSLSFIGYGDTKPIIDANDTSTRRVLELGQNSNVIFRNISFVNPPILPSSTTYEGMIYVHRARFSAYDCDFVGRYRGETFIRSYQYKSIICENCKFVNNTFGGETPNTLAHCIMLYGADANSYALINNCTFENNVNYKNSSGSWIIPVISSSSGGCGNVTISNSSFINSSLIYNEWNDNVNIKLVFDNDKFISPYDSDFLLYIRNNDNYIKNCYFENTEGGLIYTQKSIYLENNTISENSKVKYFKANLNSLMNLHYITILNNSTVDVNSINIPVNATFTDDNGNFLQHYSSYSLPFYINGTSIGSGTLNAGVVSFTTKKAYDDGIYILTSSQSSDIRVVKTATLNISQPKSADFYVAEDGDDSNDGSKDHPFRTVDKGLDALLNAAFTGNLYVKAGNYNVTKHVSIVTQGGVISIMGYGGEVIFDMQNNVGFCYVNSNSNVNISNIVFKNGKTNYGQTTYGILTVQGNLNVTNCTFINNNGYRSTIYDALTSSSKVIIDSCTFKENSASQTSYGVDYEGHGKVINSTFYGNNYVSIRANYGHTLVVDGSKFINFTKNCINGNGYSIQVKNSIFDNCTGEGTNVPIYNGGVTLSNNTLLNDGILCYAGTIYTSGVAEVLDNKTIDIESFGVDLSAKLYDDNGNLVRFNSLNFYLNETNVGSATFDNGVYTLKYKKLLNGTYIASVQSIINFTIKTATLNIVPLINKELYVSNSGSDDNDGSEAHPFKTIDKAVSEALAYNNVIHIADGNYNISSPLAISTLGGTLTIVGSGENTVIDLYKKSNFINSISSDSIVVLENLGIVNGLNYIYFPDWDWGYYSNGGSIVNSGNLTINHVSFINSTDGDSGSYGGAIYNYGTLYLLNSKFINCTASQGGAIYNTGYLYLKNNTAENVVATTGNYVYTTGVVEGVILTFNDNATQEITGSSVTLNATVTDDNGNPIAGSQVTFTLNGNNVATATLGEGIATVTVNNLKLNGEFVLSGALGAAENNVVKTATLKFNNPDVLTDAWVSTDGDDSNDGSRDHPFATIEHALTVVSAIDSTIHILGGNYTFDQGMTISDFMNLTIKGEGDVLLIMNKDPAIRSDLFTISGANSLVNIVNIAFTGGLYGNYGPITSNGGILNVYDCNFYALARGIKSSGMVNVYNSYIQQQNSAIDASNALYIVNSTIVGPLTASTTIHVVNSTFKDDRYGKITLSGTTSIFENTTFTNINYTIFYINKNTVDLTIDGCNFTHNYYPSDYGGIIYNQNPRSLLIRNSIFDSNRYNRGTLYLGSSASIINNTFKNNVANNGAVAFIVNGNIEFVNNTAFNNTALVDGDYILISGNAKLYGSQYVLSFNENQTVNVEGNTFRINATLTDIDGNLISGPTAYITLNDSSFTSQRLVNGSLDSEFKFSGEGTYIISGYVNNFLNPEDCQVLNSTLNIKQIQEKVIYVDVFGDDENGDGSENNPYLTLARAFEDINAIDTTIYIMPGQYMGDLNCGISFKPGNNTIISIIGLPDEDIVEFTNITKGLFAISSGLRDANVTVNLKNIEINNVESNSYLISLTYVNANLENITVNNCSAVNTNNAIFYFGGSTVFNTTLNNVNVLNTSAYSLFCSYDNLLVNDSSFKNLSLTHITNSGFTSLENLTIMNSVFEDIKNQNQANTMSLTVCNSTFKRFSYGIFRVYSRGCIVENSIFEDNSFDATRIFTVGSSYSYRADLTISNSVFVNNVECIVYSDSYSSFVVNGNWWGRNITSADIPSLVTGGYTFTDWVVADVTPSELTINENSTITVKFLSNDGSELNATLPARVVEAISDSAIFENGQNYTSYVIDGNEVTFTVLPDAFGAVNLTVDNQEFTLNIVKANSTVLLDVFDTTTVDGLTAVATVNDDATGEVTFTLSNGESYTVEIVKGAATLFLDTISAGEYNITAVYGGDYAYYGNEANASFKVTDVIISADDIKFAYKDPNAELVASVADENGNPLVLNLNVELNGENFTVTTGADGQAVIPLGNLTPGKYNAIISYQGLSKAASANALVTVTKAATSIDTSDVNIAYKDPSGEIVATIISEHGKALAVNLNVELNGKTYTVRTDSNGQAVIPVGNLTPGKYNAKISYKGSSNYKASSATVLVTVTKAATSIDASDVNIAYRDPTGELVATITSEHGKTLIVNLNIELNGKTYTVRTDSNGQAVLSLYDVTPGTYDAKISYKGSSNYKASTTTAKVTVTKSATSIDAGDVSIAYRDPTGELVATVTNEHGKTLVVTLSIELNGKTYNVRTDANGQAVLSLYDVTPGTYDAKISYKGSSNYKGFTTTAKVVVTKAATSIDAGDVNIAYRDPTGELVATVTNEHGKALIVTVNIELNGKTYSVRTDANGQAVLSLYDVTPGTYDVKISYKGSSNYKAASTTAKVVVTKSDTIISAPDVSVASGDPDGKLVSTIVNEHGKPLVVTMKVELDGKTFSARSDSNGQINVSTADLAPGSYVAKISYKGSSNYNPTNTTANITVKP